MDGKLLFTGVQSRARTPKDTKVLPDDDWLSDDDRDGSEDAEVTEHASSRHERSASPITGPERKKHRVLGGSAAVSKPITAFYDSEDEIIVTMKQQGFSNRRVVDRLVAEGRTKYNEKTIYTRYLRIKRALQLHSDEMLDEELTDWHEGEPELLKEAYRAADARIKEELAQVESKRWTYVSRDLERRMRKSRYSVRACKERYEAEQAGTARVVPEFDPDPEARRAERERKLEENRARRVEAAGREEETLVAKKREQVEKLRQAEERRRAREQARALKMKQKQHVQDEEQRKRDEAARATKEQAEIRARLAAKAQADRVKKNAEALAAKKAMKSVRAKVREKLLGEKRDMDVEEGRRRKEQREAEKQQAFHEARRAALTRQASLLAGSAS
ncbi:hypothetical protein LTR28_004634, partial [Elasticomyces elasticus]